MKENIFACEQPASLGWNNNYTHFKESVLLLQQLIAAPSFSGHEHAAADVLEKFGKKHGIQFERHHNNLWVYNKYFDQSKATLLLTSHIDTAQPHVAYTRNPFEPAISNRRLYGLGSNKAGACIVSMFAAFMHFYHQQHLPFNLIFAAVAEEETAGDLGIRAIMPLLKEVDFAIVGQPTQLNIAISEQDRLLVECYRYVISTHNKDDFEQTTEKLITDMEWFKNYHFGEPGDIPSPVNMTIRQININAVAYAKTGKVSFTVDINHNKSISREEIMETIRKRVLSGVTLLNCSRANHLPANHPVVETAMHLGCQPFASAIPSDCAWLYCPALKVGPGDPLRAHQPDEFIYLDEIKTGTSFYTDLLNTLPLQVLNNPSHTPETYRS